MNYFSTLASAALLSALMLFSCKKSTETDITPPPIDENTSTPIGTPSGALVKKMIDGNGGELTSTDGTVLVSIPAGALESAREISIQPITNELPGGIGDAYRILPHGEVFKKPVTIRFRYKQEDLVSTLPEFLDIASQTDEGSWESPMNATIDKQNRTLTVTSTHFSDWGYFKSLDLIPAEATVELGGSVDLKVTTHFPYVDPDDAPPGVTVIKVLKTPRALRPDEIKKWSYTGDGILISRGSEAFYTAPEEEPDANPEAVTAHVNMHRKGQFMLVSNITVLGSGNVAYLHVDEDYKSVLNNGDCMLYMYGNFGNDPGQNNRSVLINGTKVETDLWSPTVIRCRIDREIAGAIEVKSKNKTVARSVLRKYTGTFLYERFQGGKLNSVSSNPLKETTELKIVYRGFGAPCPETIDPIFYHGGIAAFGTRADYNLSGQAEVTTPGTCPRTSSISLPNTSGTFLHNTINGSAFNKFLVEVKDIEGGIEVQIQFSVLELLTGVRVKRTNCHSSSLDTPKSLGVSLEGFAYKPINLLFEEPGKIKLPGNDPLKSGNISSNILIEAWDGTGSPSHYQTDGLLPATLKNK